MRGSVQAGLTHYGMNRLHRVRDFLFLPDSFKFLPWLPLTLIHLHTPTEISAMFDWISLALTIIALIAWAIHRQKKRHDALLAKFREHNQRLGTSFPENSVDSELILSDKDKKVVIAFDPTTRKLCMVSGAKDPGEVLDFSYIRQWQLKWTEVSGNGGLAFKDVHFAFSTNDLKRPLIHIAVPGKGYGDTWDSRLGILMGA